MWLADCLCAVLCCVRGARTRNPNVSIHSLIYSIKAVHSQHMQWRNTRIQLLCSPRWLHATQGKRDAVWLTYHSLRIDAPVNWCNARIVTHPVGLLQYISPSPHSHSQSLATFVLILCFKLLHCAVERYKWVYQAIFQQQYCLGMFLSRIQHNYFIGC